MINNPKTKIEIQIEDEPAFTPDKVISAGNEFDTYETTEPFDKVRSFVPTHRFSIIHYVIDGRERKQFFQRGVWESGTNGLPRFHVFGVLAAAQQPHAVDLASAPLRPNH